MPVENYRLFSRISPFKIRNPWALQFIMVIKTNDMGEYY